MRNSRCTCFCCKEKKIESVMRGYFLINIMRNILIDFFYPMRNNQKNDIKSGKDVANANEKA